MKGNHELEVDVVTILDAVKIRVQNELRVNITNISDEITGPPVENEPEISEYKYETEIAMLGKASMSGYERMRKKILSQNILSVDCVPSYYMLTKNRPKLNSFVVHPNQMLYSLQDKDNICIDTTTDVDETSLVPLVSSPFERKMDFLSSFIGNTTISLESAFEEVRKNSVECLDGARIHGCYEDYIELMAKKHRDRNIEFQGHVIVVDSYDGAEHHRRRDKKQHYIFQFPNVPLINIEVW